MAGKKLSFVFKFLTIFTILALIIFLVLHYWINRKNVTSFLPLKYSIIVQTPPLKEIYESYLPLEVVDIAISDPATSQVRKIILSLRANELLKNFFLKQLLNIPVTILIEDKSKVLFAFDIGWRAVITRFFPFIGYNFNIKNLSLVKKENFIIFKFSDKTDLHFSFVDNILLLSLNSENIERAIERLKTKENFFEKKNRELSENITRKDKKLRVLLSPENIINNILPESPFVNNLLEKIKFYEDVFIDLSINNSNLNINIDLPIYSDEVAFQKVISSKFNYMNVLKFIPFSVSILGVVNICDFDELISLVQNFDIPDLKNSLEKADDLTKALFGKGTRELIFSWIGSEIGIYKTPLSSEATIFFKIKDQTGFNEFNEKVLKSYIVETATPLKIENVLINKIKIVDFLQFILGIFKISIPAGYYITIGNYLFLSFDPENLKELVKNFREKTTFYTTSLKGIKISLNSCLFSHYNLELETPFFLRKQNIFTKILSYYNIGTIAMSKEKKIRLSISATSKKKKLEKYLDFPKDADVNVESSIFLRKQKNTPYPYFFYFKKDNTFVIQDINLNTVYSTNLEESGELIFEETKEIRDFYIYFKSSQKLLYFKPEEKSFISYEINGIDTIFPPFFFKNNLFFYSKEKEKFMRVDAESNKLIETELTSELPVFSIPSIKRDFIAYYSKSFEGQISLVNNKLQLQSGWPVKIEGLAYGSPVILIDHGEIKVYFITQEGNLYGWNFEGRLLKGFPLKIEDVFVQSLKIIKVSGEEKLLAISKGKKMYVILPNGKIESSKFLEYIDEDARITTFDLNGDNIEEIFIYNNGNLIYALSSELVEMEGFPINGNSKPDFYDLNNDNNIEVISAGLDENIHVYTYKK